MVSPGRRLFVVPLLLALLGVCFVAPSASATPLASTVNELTVHDGFSTLTLTFDEPLTKERAAAVTRELNPRAPSQSRTSDIMFCTTGRSYTDNNGTLTLDRFCNLRQLRWSYRISSQVQAIIVSNVNETGLWYWINGTRQPRNAPHSVGRSYIFHGTMSGIDNNKTVDYQDYMTFRHNIGSGGTGSITFAGSIATRA